MRMSLHWNVKSGMLTERTYKLSTGAAKSMPQSAK